MRRGRPEQRCLNVAAFAAAWSGALYVTGHPLLAKLSEIVAVVALAAFLALIVRIPRP